ncbi:MAG: TetR/AcrR family transcriptional regulator [Polyangia bacterium]
MSTEPEKIPARPGESRPRGRPRSERCRLAVREATVELLEELPYSAISVEAIAARASVSKQTIYRWWTGKHQLAMEAYAELMDTHVAAPVTNDLESDLRELCRRSCRVLSQRKRGTTLAGLIVAAQHDDVFAKEFRERYILVRRKAVDALLRRGVDEGKLKPTMDIQLAIDEIYGPMWYRLLLRHLPLDDAFADALATAFLSANSVE